MIKVNNHADRIGDSIIPEPALYAYGIRNKTKVSLYTQYPELYAGHPVIETTESPHPEPDITLDAQKAFQDAHWRRLPFGAGYFTQLDMRPLPGDRLYYRYYPLEVPDFQQRSGILIAPFACSCASRKGQKANIMASLDWWDQLLEQIPEPCYSLGSKDEPNRPEKSVLVRGVALPRVLQLMSKAKLLISVETGLLCFAVTTKIPTIFLSSATPKWFSSPTGATVIRAATPNWDQKEVLRAISSLT